VVHVVWHVVAMVVVWGIKICMSTLVGVFGMTGIQLSMIIFSTDLLLMISL